MCSVSGEPSAMRNRIHFDYDSPYHYRTLSQFPLKIVNSCKSFIKYRAWPYRYLKKKVLNNTIAARQTAPHQPESENIWGNLLFLASCLNSLACVIRNKSWSLRQTLRNSPAPLKYSSSAYKTTWLIMNLSVLHSPSPDYKFVDNRTKAFESDICINIM